MLRILMVACLVMTPAAASLAATPPQRPFETTLPWTPERGAWEVASGLLHQRDTTPPFFAGVPETRRDAWRLDALDVSLGLGGGGEVRLRFGAQRIEEASGNRTTGVQDARVDFTYRLPSRSGRTASCLTFGVKLPNASGEDRLGTDETDVRIGGSIGQDRLRGGWAAGAGLALLGSPLTPGTQDDVLTFGAAGWLRLPRGGERVSLVAEVAGSAASRFGNDDRVGAAGVRLGSRWPVDLTIRRGLTSASESWGAALGLTFFAGPRGR